MILKKRGGMSAMNKKRLIIFSSLILTLCFGLFFVIAAFTSVTLDSPVAYYNQSSTTGVFNCTAIISDNDVIVNMSLYLNQTGIGPVEFNQTNSSAVSNATTYEFTVPGISEGSHNWTCVAVDNSSNVEWGSSRIITIDASGPTVNLSNPNNNIWNTNGSTVVFGFTAIDNLLLIDTCQLYGDFNGSWLLNQTDTSVTNGTQTNFTALVLDDSSGYTWNIWCNDTVGNGAWSGSNRTIKVDTAAPTATITAPSDTTITVQNSIKYTCSGSDSGSGVSSCTMTVTKPDGTTYTKTGCTEQTLQSTDTNQAGTYTVDCSIEDAVGNTGTATSTTFIALYSSGGGSGSSGGGGTGTETTSGESEFDLDLSGTVVEATLSAKQGVIKTFSFDGATKHTITFKEVGTDKVVLEIASDPVTVELSVGETKEVDVNGDGINDVSITLNSIENEKADITVKKLEEGAKIVKGEEEETRGVGGETAPEVEPSGEEPVAAEPEAKSKAWVWILVLVVVVIGVVAYFVMRKK
jgi:hypothetical protein